MIFISSCIFIVQFANWIYWTTIQPIWMAHKISKRISATPNPKCTHATFYTTQSLNTSFTSTFVHWTGRRAYRTAFKCLLCHAKKNFRKHLILTPAAMWWSLKCHTKRHDNALYWLLVLHTIYVPFIKSMKKCKKEINVQNPLNWQYQNCGWTSSIFFAHTHVLHASIWCKWTTFG